MEIGFIGLGVMGVKMAANLLKAGHQLYVYDIIEDGVVLLLEQGAKRAISPADVAKNSRIIMTSLPNSLIVEQVILGDGGILSGAKRGDIIIDLSSITPKIIKKISGACTKKGVEVIDAPVSGGVKGATQGSLTIMVGGKKNIFESVKEVLSAIGKNIEYIGDIGAGDTIKAVNNLLLGLNMVAIAEAFVLGKKAGLDEDTMYRIIGNSSGSSYALTAKYQKFISPRNFEPGFMINLMHKDLQLAIETAKELNVPLVNGVLSQQLFQMAKAEGLGCQDISAVIKIFEKWADVHVGHSA